MDGMTYTKENEGLRLHAYADPLTEAAPYACGWGCLWNAKGEKVTQSTIWTMEEAEQAFNIAYDNAEYKVRTQFFYCWKDAPDAMKAAATDMSYQIAGFPIRWPSFRQAFTQGDWERCAAEIRSSLYHTQTPKRAERNARVFETGILA